jgi:hypothetical protein
MAGFDSGPRIRSGDDYQEEEQKCARTAGALQRRERSKEVKQRKRVKQMKQ